jgi:CTP:phosphocholine cytidylyltransferase-like protein/thiamine kinase-like enzyme
LKESLSVGYLKRDVEEKLVLTDTGQAFLDKFRVRNAIFLAAGFGSRCVPLTFETPKGLLEVYGKPMIERQIEQLLEKGISEIIIVVGYKKEKFDYLIDKYGVKLVYNPEYATKNNLASLHCVLPWLDSSYILMSDNWIEKNIFNLYEPHSWFSCLYFEGPTHEWCVTASAGNKIEFISIGGQDAWAVVGPAYFSPSFSARFKQLVTDYYKRPGTEDYYWEHILRENINSLPMYMNRQTGNVHEFENLEELRMFDPSYNRASHNKIMEGIAELFNVPEEKIQDIYPIKEGLTNSSFHFSIGAESYVYRIPGTGTDKLINRKNEKAVYDAIGKLGMADEIINFDAESGVKISRFIDNARVSDPFNDAELEICMKQIRKIHESGISSPNSYSIDKMIDYYVSLAEGLNAIRFSDIAETKEKVKRLLDVRRKLAIPDVLCHGDYAHVNVLVLPDGSSRIIDWEFAGMGDPVMDVAMYAIFAEFDKERIDLSLHFYLGREPAREEWIRLYMYVALGGFLWTMWSQYKQALGQEFGEYPLIMYRYMKDFYRLLDEKFNALKG